MAPIDVMELHSAGAAQRPRFDYKGRHRYLVTLPTFQKHRVFTDLRRCRAVLDALRDRSIEAGFDVVAYVFLPDELTMLVRGERDDADMKGFLVSFRAASSGALEGELGHTLWKKVYRERVLRKTEESREIARQIFLIPVGKGLVDAPERYQMLGSFVYSVHRLLESDSPQRPPRGQGKPLRKPPSGGRASHRPPRRPKHR